MNAIVFSGGGAKGAYEAGLVSTLITEYDEKFDVVCGTSIGAINASFTAQDKITELAGVWRTIKEANIVDPVPRVAAIQKLLNEAVAVVEAHGLVKFEMVARTSLDTISSLQVLSPLEKLVTVTGALEPTGAQKILSGNLSLSDVKRILIVSATNLTCQRQETFFTFPGDYVQHQAAFCKAEPEAIPFRPDLFAETVRASGAIPGAFEPVRLPVQPASPWAYVDGGVTNNTPIGQAIDAGADSITIVYVDPDSGPSQQPSANLAEILMGCFSLMQQRILALDYQTALRVNDAVGANANDTKGKQIVRIRTFRPATALAPGIIDFNKQDLVDSAFADGQAAARNAALRERWVT
jgi:NTE family protein